jgi:hypothetical protein
VFFKDDECEWVDEDEEVCNPFDLFKFHGSIEGLVDRASPTRKGLKAMDMG